MDIPVCVELYIFQLDIVPLPTEFSTTTFISFVAQLPEPPTRVLYMPMPAPFTQLTAPTMYFPESVADSISTWSPYENRFVLEPTLNTLAAGDAWVPLTVLLLVLLIATGWVVGLYGVSLLISGYRAARLP
jgi:hypothetical protein